MRGLLRGAFRLAFGGGQRFLTGFALKAFDTLSGQALGGVKAQLAALLPIVPCAGLVDLYYDIWYCVPSRLAFRLAVRLLHDPSRLSDFLVLAERVLVDEASCAAFAAQVQEDDELHEVVGWLKRRAPR